MSSRATPPIVPTFGDPSGNQHYTMYFDNVTKEKKNVNKVKGEGVLEESQGKKATNFVSKKPSNQYAKTNSTSDEKGYQDDHLKHKDDMDMKSVNDTSNVSFNEKSNNSGKKSPPSQYQGRLGNRLSSFPQKPSENKVQPNTRRGSASSLPYENHVKDMKFGAWEENPEVPITAVFDKVKRKKEAGLFLHSPVLYSDGRIQGTPSHKKISNDDYKKSSWWSRLNPKKWWKRLVG